MNEVWDESTPTNNTDAYEIDDEFRKLKRAIRERAGVSHITYSDEEGKDDVWEHKRGTAKLEFGTLANRPEVNPDHPGLIYVSIDKNSLTSYDNGTEWVNINEQYKVGDIYITTHTQNPKDFFGYGTWEEFSKGRTLMGFDSDDADFNAIEKTGGEKRVILKEAQMPKHNHHYLKPTKGNWCGMGGGVPLYNTDWVPSGWAGNSESHQNLSPYITVKVWKRIE